MAEGDLLGPVVPEEEQHPSFRTLISEPRFESAREKLREAWAAFSNPDEHFIREFQTAAFDARVWELVLFSVGHFGPYVPARHHAVRMTRVGTCMNFDPTATLPSTFGYLVGDIRRNGATE